MRTRGQIDLKNRGLVVGPGHETHLGVEVFVGNTMAGVDVEPIISVC